MRNDDLDRVVPLDQLDDFQVADGDPDIRGWDVLAADGRKIGEVDELLVDTAAMKVRYLDVDLDDNLAGDGERHVLIPIGYARLDRDADHVVVDALRADDLGSLPAYGHGPLTREFETSVRDSFSSRGSGPDDRVTERGPLAADDDRTIARDASAMGTRPGFGAASGTVGGSAGIRADAPTATPTRDAGEVGTSGTAGAGFLRDETTTVGDRGRTGTTGGMTGGFSGGSTPDTTGAGFGGAGERAGSDLSGAAREGLTDRLSGTNVPRDDEAGPGHTRGGARNADDFYAGRDFDDTAFWSSRRGRQGGI